MVAKSCTSSRDKARYAPRVGSVLPSTKSSARCAKGLCGKVDLLFLWRLRCAATAVQRNQQRESVLPPASLPLERLGLVPA